MGGRGEPRTHVENIDVGPVTGPTPPGTPVPITKFRPAPSYREMITDGQWFWFRCTCVPMCSSVSGCNTVRCNRCGAPQSEHHRTWPLRRQIICPWEDE